MSEYTHVENEFGVVECEQIISAATKDGKYVQMCTFWHATKEALLK